MVEDLNYNLKKFGSIMYNIRRKLKLTQKTIRKHTGLHSETIRKLEYGDTLPSMDTMVKLGRIYFVDVTKILEECKYENEDILKNITKKLDIISSTDNFTDIDDLVSAIKNYSISSIPNVAVEVKNKIQQLEYLIELVKLKNNNDIASVIQSEQISRQAIRLTHPMFSIAGLEENMFDIVELRVLIALSISLSRQNNFESATKLCEHIIKALEYHQLSNSQAVPVLIQALFTQSYFYYIINKHAESIHQSTKGIEISMSHHNMKFLANLYFRKGASEFRLDNTEYYLSFEKCIMALELTDSQDLKKSYLSIMKKDFDFVLEKKLSID